MRFKVLLITLCLSTLAYSQQKIEKSFFDETGKKTDSLNAVSYHHLIFTDTIIGSGVVKKFKIDGTLTQEIEYANINKKNDSIKKWTKEGLTKFYHENGELKIIESYKKNKLDGEVTTYFENTKQLKRKDIFKDDVFVSGTCYDYKGLEIEHFDYFIKPEYDGGNRAIYRFISRNLKYPNRMRQIGSEGKVIVSFTVTKEAEVTSIRIVRSPNTDFSKEAIRVVRLLKIWKSGVRDGEKIDVRYALPISFKLQ